jgi:hypothetical protein
MYLRLNDTEGLFLCISSQDPGYFGVIDYELCSLTIDKNKVMDREVCNFVETQDSRSLKAMSMPELKT